ncbi:MAG: 2-amino-4-hydroxy-6-hydroxymethyldihydropteridine diphosphokinase [Ignavibacteria bacterium]|nr:2-amino-4-hydroxy-6-hydroxymethyldihydropteridine diphosphokinase [Ignavibacteria bacterium]
MIHKTILGLGSNKGNRLLSLRKALHILSSDWNLNLLKVSSIYESEPWGEKDQRDFLNCVAVFLCRMNSEELLNFVKDAEIMAGRTVFEKWKEREIDIDILFFGNLIIKKKNLRIPHPHLTERNFVLEPLCEIIPDLVHPENKRSVYYLKLNSKDKSKVKVINRNWII